MYLCTFLLRMILVVFQQKMVIIVVVVLILVAILALIIGLSVGLKWSWWAHWMRGDLRVSISVVPQWAWVWGILWLCTCLSTGCVCFLSFQRAYLRCVCVYLKFLGVCMFSLFWNTCLWLLLNKQSTASSRLVSHIFSLCLVNGPISMLMLPVANIFLPFFCAFPSL